MNHQSISETNLEIATLGGGCFWCTQAIFKRLKGVVSVVAGYAGGDAESIQIKFDPSIISYEKLLEVFWATHDPTTLNRQGADVGIQYRSIIFYHNDEQKKLAESSRQNLEQSSKFKSKIVTQILLFDKFYKAEEYHQNFYDKNKSYLYCQIVIDPKIQKLLKEFSKNIKEDANN